MTDATTLFQPIIDALWTGVWLVISSAVIVLGIATLRLNIPLGLCVSIAGCIAFIVAFQYATPGPFENLGWAAPLLSAAMVLNTVTKRSRF